MRTLKNKVRDWLRVTGCRLGAKNPRRGFTLIELIVVMAIIAILAGIALPALRRARTMAHIASARAMITSLGMALSMYETDFGRYPTKGPPATYNHSHYEILSLLTGRDPVYWTIDTAITGNPQWHGPYLEVRREDLRQIGPPPYRYHLIDPWGTPFVISVALDRDLVTRPWHNVFGFDIFSLGPDKRTYRGQTFKDQGDVGDLTNHFEDGHTTHGIDNPVVDPDGHRKWLLDDINNW